MLAPYLLGMLGWIMMKVKKMLNSLEPQHLNQSWLLRGTRKSPNIIQEQYIRISGSMFWKALSILLLKRKTDAYKLKSTFTETVTENLASAFAAVSVIQSAFHKLILSLWVLKEESKIIMASKYI